MTNSPTIAKQIESLGLQLNLDKDQTKQLDDATVQIVNQAIEGVQQIGYKDGFEDGFKYKENNLKKGWKEAKQYLIKKFRGK